MELRRYCAGDLEEVVRLNHDTINHVNIADYSPEQVRVWSAGCRSALADGAVLQSLYTIVAIEDGAIVGYGNIDASGYLDHLYVHKDRQRQGIATAICDRLESECDAVRIVTHASITAKPFFEQRGYRVVREQRVLRQGVELTNFIMEKENRRQKG